MELRPYQSAIVADVRRAMQEGKRAILVQSPTGSGKTALTAHMLSTAASKGMNSLFIVHRRELIKQSMRAFDKVGLRHGIIAAGFMEELTHRTQIASISTLANRLDRIQTPKLIVWDECHHLAAGSWSKVFRSYPDAFHIGLTATPERLDGKGLGDYFDVMINGPSVSWLIEHGYLSQYKVFAPAGVNMTGVHTRMGDFVRSELVAAVDKPTITGSAIREYKRHCDGARAVVFCASIEHSQHVVAQFNASGIPALHVDGESGTDVRDQAIARFDSGSIKVLSNVDICGEGFDLPAIECGILLRPTQSLGLHLQQVGRTLRPSPGKTCAIILDHAGNCERHGLPDDERVWSLEGREISRKSGEKGPAVKVCPKCFAAQKPGRPACVYCGHVYEIQAREIKQVEGDLVEMTREKLKRRQEQGRAHTLQDLVEIGKARGYKRPHLWAKFIFNARQHKRNKGG